MMSKCFVGDLTEKGKCLVMVAFVVVADIGSGGGGEGV